MILDSIRTCLSPLLDCLARVPSDCAPLLPQRSVPSLPQDASHRQQRHRQQELDLRRSQYRYNYNYIPGLAMVQHVPLRELPGLDWFMLAIGQGLKVVDNLLALLDSDAVVSKSAALAQRGRSAARSTDRAARSADVAGMKRRLEELRSHYQVRLAEHPLAQSVRSVHAVRGAVAAELTIDRQTCETADTAVFAVDSCLWVREINEALSSSACTCGLATSTCVELFESTRETAGFLATPCIFCLGRTATELLKDLDKLVGQLVEDILGAHDLFGRPTSLEDYNRQFQEIPLPEAGKQHCPAYFNDDRSFALSQVAGQNPMMLTLVRDLGELRKQMPITEEQYRSVMDGDTLAAAVVDKRLYIVNYQFSENVTQGSAEPKGAGQKYIGAPIGLFALTPDAREITAVAIQCRQKPGSHNPIITPGDGESWSIAKTVFNNAAGNNSEFVQHLGYAHLLVEAFGLAMVRTLPSAHPLNMLLTPHIEGTMFANNLAQSGMNAPPDRNLILAEISASIPDTLGWTRDAVLAVDVNEWLLPLHFERQGTADKAALPHYPYREDSLRIWYAIHDWVDAYVRLYYQDDGDLRGDYELQSWAAELVTNMHLRGIGDNGRFATVENLVDIVTLIIYQSAAHHALTNFPLQQIELYVPGLPLAIFQPPPTQARGASFEDWLAYYPPLEISIIQLSLYFVIGTLHYTQLGRYPARWFADSRVDAPLEELQSRLKQIQREITADNLTRPMPYIYLLPERIPQSTNI